MCFLDFLTNPSSEKFTDLSYADKERWQNVDLGATYSDRELDSTFRRVGTRDTAREGGLTALKMSSVRSVCSRFLRLKWRGSR